ncbi:HIT family protein [Roseixanthobacter liquoris]|uniref:HIT family protein n=1 Tax=Roseixanthobacter liquoris TaxID=3119921 RepID=UPI0037284066
MQTATPPYDPDNIFARIVRGELPCERLYEDAHAIAFMDIMPQSAGHAVVVPKRAGRNLLDTDPAVLGPLMDAVRKVAQAVKTAMEADGVVVMQFNEAPAGQTIFHLHVHVLPRYSGADWAPHAGARAEPQVLAAQAARIRAALEP